jgi:transglutaminase-like putative cysteine protease
MDFSAWFEVHLGDRWYTLDARHNQPRIGRILMGPAGAMLPDLDCGSQHG